MVWSPHGLLLLSFGPVDTPTLLTYILSCQIAFYEQVKQILLATGYFKDNTITHFSSSVVAVSLPSV